MAAQTEFFKDQFAESEAAPKSGATGMDAAITTEGGDRITTEGGDVEATEAVDVEARDDPFTEVAGRFVRLADLEALTDADGSPAFSDTVLRTLNRAAREPHQVSLEGSAVVDAWSYLRAAIIDGATESEIFNTHNLLNRLYAPSSLEPNDIGADRVVRLMHEDGLPDTDAPIDDPARAVATAVLDPGMTSVLADARELAALTVPDPPQSRIDARHIVVALLRAEVGRAAFAELGLITPGRTMPFASFETEFLAQVVQTPAAGESREAWTAALAPVTEADIPAWAQAASAPAYHSHFDTDRPVGIASDALEVAADARALAELICLRKAEPPLAIGLFGDWGAGKSTFMGMLQEAVGEVSSKAEGESVSPFVQRVAHIQFNAWHYIDANLWASLVTHIFRELYRQSVDDRRDWLTETKLSHLVERLETLRTAKQQSAQRRATLDEQRKRVEGRLHELETERAATNVELLQKAGRATIDMIALPANRGELDKANRELGLGDAVLTARQLRDTVQDAFTLGGRLKLVVTTLTGNERAPMKYLGYGGAALLIALAATALVAAAVAGVAPAAADAVAGLGAVLGLVTAATAWLKPHLAFVDRTLRPLVQAWSGLAGQVEQLEAERRTEQADLQRRLADLRVEQVRHENEHAELTQQVESLEAMARGERPTELLAEFIRDRASGDRYSRHLGLISHIHRDFRLMAELMASQRSTADDAPAPDPSLPQIDRIVLYIDDLDRCQHRQVVEVLQAVHLLLAFDLFVVVVGVDARWLARSLERVYPDQIAPVRGPVSTGSVPGSMRTATASDYLEKIFQIPYWVRPLGTNYARLIGKLVGPDVVEAARGGSSSGTRAGAQKLVPIDVSLHEGGVETVDQTLQRVSITDREYTLMRKLGALAGRTPRAVKRFVNLYRLIRVRHRGTELTHFLGETAGDSAPVQDRLPTYPFIMFWLAAEVGLPVAVGGALRRLFLLEGANAVALIREVARTPVEEVSLDDVKPHDRDELRAVLEAIEPDAPAMDAALGEVLDHFGGPVEDDQFNRALGAALDEPSRYSFQGGQGIES